jgi:hypothetical protein
LRPEGKPHQEEKAFSWTREVSKEASALLPTPPTPPPPPSAGVQGSRGPAGRAMTLTAMVAGPVTANDPDGPGWRGGGGSA